MVTEAKRTDLLEPQQLATCEDTKLALTGLVAFVVSSRCPEYCPDFYCEIPMANSKYEALLDNPTHVACIMDGSGRWATRRGLGRAEGHAEAEKAMLSVVDGAIDIGIQWLTLYTFSTENWNRPVAERDFILALIAEIIDRRGGSFHARNIRVRCMGRRDRRIPMMLLNRIKSVEYVTRQNTGLTLTFALNYGGRGEIVDAAATLARRNTPISEESLTEEMYCPDAPEPDLVLRFGGERRLSNFMLWHIAYAELDFIDTLWPDVRDQDLAAAVTRYRCRTRRFGGLTSSAQTSIE